MHIRFSQIWIKIKKAPSIELFKICFENELRRYQCFNENGFEIIADLFLNNSKKFKNENELKSHCHTIFNLYKEKYLIK